MSDRDEAVRHCRIVGTAHCDDALAQPCEIDFLLDPDGCWSIDVIWPMMPASPLHIHSNNPHAAAMLARIMAPGQPAGRAALD